MTPTRNEIEKIILQRIDARLGKPGRSTVDSIMAGVQDAAEAIHDLVKD